MKNLSRVVWSEGMALGPHHFQAQNRYFEDSVHFSVSNLWFAAYGLIGFELSAEALRNGSVALVHARGVFPDGLAFHMPEHDALPRPRNITDAMGALSEKATLLLASPPLRAEGLNCVIRDEDAGKDARYRAEASAFPDENTGRDEKPIRIGRKNIRFLLESEEELIGDSVTLPIARILRDGAGGFAYDENFVPPCLRISAARPLMDRLKRLIEVIEEKCKSVARPRELGVGTTSGFSAEGIANAWFLHCLNSALGPLRHLCFAKNCHPEELYTEMARVGGALCTFGLESHPSALPLYDHLRLTERFAELDRHIRAHLELIVPSNCVEIPLTPVAQYFWEAKIEDERTLGRSRWILAMRSDIGEADLIDRTPRLVKICSREFLPKLVQRALPGLTLTHLPTPPPAVSPKIEFQYFAVDKAGPCWEHMMQSRQLGVYAPGELPHPEVQLFVVLES